MISNIDKSEAIPMLFIPSVEQTAMKTLKKEYALYIHIPYCEKKCHFCSIPVTRFTDEMVLDRYVDALLYELKYKEEFLKKNTLIVIHIGGGTTSVLSVLQIKRLFDFITEMFGKELPEVVFEANPASLTKEKIDVLSQYYNVTLNLGVQTFNSQRLQEINRMNDVEAIKECLRYAMQKENLHVGIDLIVGLPNSKIIDFDNDIKIVRELGIKNIFIYSYRLEEKSFFYNYFDKKKCFLQNDMIRKMEYAEERIKNFGYIAKSIYYWSIEKDSLYRYTSHQMNGGEWVGIGDGAYSYLEHSVMHNNFIGRNYQKYLNEIKQNQIFAQNVTSQMIWDISLMVKKDVFDTKRIIQKYGKIVEPYLRKLGKRLEENGYSQNRNNKVCLSVKGKVLLDDVDKIIQEVVLN